MLWIVLLIGLLRPSEQRSLSLTDLQNLVDTIGDEIVSHDGLHTAAQMPEAVVRRILRPLHKTTS
jgi:hypothetical protein